MDISKSKMDKIHKNTVKRDHKVRKKELAPHPDYSAAFLVNEVKVAIGNMTLDKAAGFDGVYAEFFKHSGPKTQTWLAMFFSDILSSLHIPVLKVIAILKPEKQGSDVSNYR